VQDASGNNGLQPVRDATGVTVKSFEIGYHSMVIYNMDSGKATNDLKVRQAIDKAIDRDSLQQTLLGGHATRSFFPDYSPWFQSDAATGESRAATRPAPGRCWTRPAGRSIQRRASARRTGRISP